jgi:hypothetical protein
MVTDGSYNKSLAPHILPQEGAAMVIDAKFNAFNWSAL